MHPLSRHARISIVLLLLWLTSSATAQEERLMPVPDQFSSGPGYEPEPVYGEPVFDGSEFGDWGAEYGDVVYDGEHPDYDLGIECAECGAVDCIRCSPHWYFESGFIMMTQSRRRDNPFAGINISASTTVLDENNNPITITIDNLQTLLGVGSAEFHYEGGPRVTLGRYLGTDERGLDMFGDLTYWGINDWGETATRVGERVSTQVGNFVVTQGNLENLFFQGNLGVAFDNADVQSLAYNTDLEVVELNLRIRREARGRDQLVLLPGGDWFPGQKVNRFATTYNGGLRYMRVDETFLLESFGTQRTEFLGNTIQTGQRSAAYTVRTDNDMLGAQLGFLTQYVASNWDFGIRAQGSLMGNFMAQKTNTFTQAVIDSVVVNVTTTEHGDASMSAAVLGEVGLQGSVQVGSNIRLRGRWDFMWLGGLALAPDQVVNDEATRKPMNDEGIIFYQGGGLSAEVVW